MERTEKSLAALNGEKQTLEARMAKAMAPAELAEAGKRLKAVNDQIATLEESWLAVSHTIEQTAAC